MDPEETAAPEGVESEGAPEGVEASEEEAAPEEGPSFLDTLMSDEPPESVRALEEAAQRNGTTYKVSAEAFEGFPLEAKEMVTNLRRMATKSTQESAALKREFAEKLKELEQRTARFNHEKASLLGMFKGNEKLKALLEEPEGEVSFDPFTDEGRRNLMAKEAREMFGEFFKTIEGVSDEYAEAAKEAANQVRLNDERAALKTFIGETEDWSEYASKTKELVKTRGLHWKEAYLLAKALNPPKATSAPDPIEESRREARRVSRPGSSAGASSPTLADLVRTSGY